MSKTTAGPARRWRRRLGVGATVIATAGVSVGFTMAAEASGGESTTNVSFVSLATPYKLLTNKAFAANASDSVVVIGGSTKVPSNATTVQLSVTGGGTTAGTLNFYPAGNASGGSGQFLSWTAEGTNVATIEENVGLSDELTFALTGGAAKVTATITGYSTQVTDGDISPADGTSGQVLTNNGTGAAWQGPSGGPAFANANGSEVHLSDTSYSAVDTLTVPAGDYFVTFDAEIDNIGAQVDDATCYLLAPDGSVTPYVGAAVPAETGSSDGISTISPQGLIDTAGGTITAECKDTTDTAYANLLGYPNLVAIQVSSVSGTQADVAHGSGLPAKSNLQGN
jgi:hypothetical protein